MKVTNELSPGLDIFGSTHVSRRAPMFKVCVVQRRLTHYRVPFFEALRHELANRNCELILAHGNATAEELGKNDGGVLDWATKLPTRYFLGGKLCWQPFQKMLGGVDLVVVTPENKMIYNLAAQYLHQGYRLGLWGHGANLQGNPSSLRERFKRRVATQADWWFAYTDMSLPLVERTGFPNARVTVLNNSVDTAELVAMRQCVTIEATERLRLELGLIGTHVGVYVGSLYAEKRIEFMLEAATRIRRALPSFEFLIMGSGPQQALVERFCEENPWAKYLGVRKGQAKVDAMALAKVTINPGLVGLGILDSFVCGVPMVTTDCGLHSPEIVYLENGENGLMTANTIDDYVASVVSLLSNDDAVARLRAGCEVSAKKYTVENMARNFADGVMQCLEAPMYRGRGGS